MTEYTTCPSPACQSKVVLWPTEDGYGINFCCLNCWNNTWAGMTDATDDLPEGYDAHSIGCNTRQAKRVDMLLADLPPETALVVMGRQHHEAIKALKARSEDAPVSTV